MTFAAHSIIVRSLVLAGLALFLSACTESGGGANPAISANTVTVSGTVGGTRIVAMNDNDQIVVEDDTAGRPPSAPGRFPFTLSSLPVGSNLRLFFISNGSMFPFYLGGTNVFTFNNAGPVDFGFVTMDAGTGRSTPEFPPLNVTPKPENPNIPPGLTSNDLKLESVISGLEFPVGMALAPDGRVFFNERLTGKIRIINPQNPQWQLVNTPFCQLSVATNGEQGLLGLTLDPNFAQNHFVYVYYTEAGAARNRVVRYTEVSGLCTGQTTILDTLPVNSFHNGGIIQFGPDGKLYVIIGDAGNMANSQNLTSLAGKILRVNPDGSAPSDNPFFNNADANAKKVFSFGHRNSYGFTFHPHTNHLWETENGPQDSDEINRIIAGGNYAWDANQRRGILKDPCCVDPIAVFFPAPCNPCTIAPTGIIAIPENSTVYPVAYRNNLLFVNFNFGQIRRLVLTGANLTQLGTQSIAYNGGNGGLLSLMLGADGYVYVSNASAIFKVVSQ